jgi:hypothetical protein
MVQVRNLLLEFEVSFIFHAIPIFFLFLLTKRLGHVGICEKSLDNLQIGI